MISEFFDRVLFDPIQAVFAFIIYWIGWFIIIPLAIWCLYKLMSKLYDSIERKDWLLIFLQIILIVGLVFVSYKLFAGFTNAGKNIDPYRPTGIEKSIQEVGNEYD